MEKSRKILGSILIVALIASVPVFAGTVFAGTTDTFTVTVKGFFLDIQINRTTWSVNGGTAVPMSNMNWSNSSNPDPAVAYFNAILYNNSVNVDLKLHVSSDGADWTVGDAIGADTYRLNATHDLWTTIADCINLTGGAQTLKTGIVAGNNQTFDLRFDSPSSTTTGDEQTITITATVSEG